MSAHQSFKTKKIVSLTVIIAAYDAKVSNLVQ